MPLKVNTNTPAIAAQNIGRLHKLFLERNTQQLSSGKRLVTASVAPADLAISQTMRAQIGGVERALSNVQDTISLGRVAEGTLSNQTQIIGRMRDVAIQASNSATLTDQQRNILNQEFQTLNAELTRAGQATTFNTKPLLTDVAGQEFGTQTAQVGPETGQQLDITLNASTAATLGATGNELALQDISTTTGAQNAITAIDNALQEIVGQRVNIGVTENRLSSITNTLNEQRINTLAANSRIEDMNMAEGITNRTKSMLLGGINLSMMAQANAQNVGVLNLLGA